MTREQQIEATRRSHMEAIRRAREQGRESEAAALEGSLRSLEAQWASECPHRRGARRQDRER